MAGVLTRVGSLLGSKAGKLKRAEAFIAEDNHIAAFKMLIPLAQAGEAKAEYLVARAYLMGNGAPRSATEGAFWLERAAEHGHLESQSMLASLYVQGVLGQSSRRDADLSAIARNRPSAGLFGDGDNEAKPDFERAIVWATRAADGGSADGKALLAYILTSGPEALRDLARGEQFYREAAMEDCPQGYLGYALILLRRNDPSVLPEAVGWMRKGADAGLPTALYLLGALTEQGQGTEADPVLALDLYRQAAERGLRAAQVRYGSVLMEGRGAPKNAQEGESWLRRAALQGDTDAAAMVGDLYARSDGDLPPNYAEAAMWYRRAAEGGHKAAARALGLMHLNGTGMPRDREEAARWFRRSAEAGDATSRYDLANLVLRREAAPEEAQRTREWFEQEAAKGDAVGAYNFGICLAEGVGVERNDAEALVWLRRAADTVVNAQYWYGRMVIEGRGTEPNPTLGREWIERAAEAGMLDAQVAFAEILVNGVGGEKDHPKALVLFERAAKAGHVGATFAMGAMLGGGHDVPWDRPAAQRWFQTAAERGHGYAQMMLGRYLARGLAGDVDIEAARRWLNEAVARGVKEAQGDLAALPPPEDAAPVSAGDLAPDAVTAGPPGG